MFSLATYLFGLAAVLAAAFITWLVSLDKHDVSIVDSVWAFFFVFAASAYTWTLWPAIGPRTLLVLILLGFWAVRLSGYITWRNWDEGEDARYQEIRRRNEPGFAWKSIYLVFVLQALLAWIISAPLLSAIASSRTIGLLDFVGLALCAGGLLVEAIADWQLARFKSHQENRGRVMDQGLWRYSRHPNYFGECCVWWGFYLVAAAAGDSWTVFSPVLMTFLLLKVSGVALLENNIVERRPQYRDYIARTSAFVPWWPRKNATEAAR
jgi:steroid 5-alpha reductase family enzyme